MQVNGLALPQGGENDEGDDGGFFALLHATAEEEGMAVLPQEIPEDVPTAYEIPEDRVHVARNQKLKETYDLMGQWINDVLATRRKEAAAAKDAKSKSLRKQSEGTVKIIGKLNDNALKVINRLQTGNEPAFEVPEIMKPALKFVLP